MRQDWHTVAIRVGLLLVLTAAGPAWAQKPGGILKMQHWDSPASMSIHEEATYSVVMPMMGVMNNLMIYNQDVPQNIIAKSRGEEPADYAQPNDRPGLEPYSSSSRYAIVG